MEGERVHRRRQGDRGELAAAAWFAERGATVSVPLFHVNPDYDLIADWGSCLERVQVKTTTYFHQDRWNVTLSTRGGNRSWTGVVKRLDPDRYDRLFVLAGDGRRWLLPSGEVGGGTGILLGGPKYAPYELERGRPLLA